MMNINNQFWQEFINKTEYAQGGKYRKYGDTYYRCKMVEEDVVFISSFISYSPIETFKSFRFITNLCDKYNVTIKAETEPFSVDSGFDNKGFELHPISKERLFDLYRAFGCTVEEKHGVNYLTRIPRGI